MKRTMLTGLFMVCALSQASTATAITPAKHSIEDIGQNTLQIFQQAKESFTSQYDIVQRGIKQWIQNWCQNNLSNQEQSTLYAFKQLFEAEITRPATEKKPITIDDPAAKAIIEKAMPLAKRLIQGILKLPPSEGTKLWDLHGEKITQALCGQKLSVPVSDYFIKVFPQFLDNPSLNSALDKIITSFDNYFITKVPTDIQTKLGELRTSVLTHLK